MPKVPSEKYDRILAALWRLGFAVTRQRSSHIRLEKRVDNRRIKITVPAHRPAKRSTLSHILKREFRSMIFVRRCRMETGQVTRGDLLF
ncbi:MAG: type II toxin-antitoxin system HicA family toxin [Candidatus Saccharimonadales bacterium]